MTAQDPVFATALRELRDGRKRSHWMWFVFPQLRGLGRSPTARFYGIASLDEARAYLAHPTLGPRLEEAARALLAIQGPIQGPIQGRSLHAVLGSPDDMKFRSSMTLFALAAAGGNDSLYRQALDRWCDGREDEATRSLLGGAGAAGTPP